MYDQFVRERISALRLQKGVSEYKMSYDLGHCRGYINNISSGKSLPSMSEFFAICEYFGLSPEEFFKTNPQDPKTLSRTCAVLEQLEAADLELVLMFASRLSK